MQLREIDYYEEEGSLSVEIIKRGSPKNGKHVLEIGNNQFFTDKKLKLTLPNFNFKIIEGNQIVETEENDGKFLVVFEVLPSTIFCHCSKRFAGRVNVEVLEKEGCEIMEIIPRVDYDSIMEKDLFNIFIVAIFEKDTSSLKIRISNKSFFWSLTKKTDYEIKYLYL